MSLANKKTLSSWNVLKTKFTDPNINPSALGQRRSSTGNLTITTKFQSPRSRSGTMHSHQSPSSSRRSSRRSSPRSPRISRAEAKKNLSIYNTGQLDIMRRFIMMAEHKHFLLAFSAWKAFLLKHREWDAKRKAKAAKRKVIMIAQAHPPGTRSEEHIDELGKWIKYSGPSIFKKLLRREIEDVCQHMISKTYKPKELLFLQGQKGHHYWIIIQGQVKIYIEDNKHDEQVKLHNYTNQGTEWCNNVLECDPNWLGREVARMNGGGFGELALFEGTGLRNASAATSGEEKIEMIGLPKHIYLRTISYMHREAFVTKRKINFLKQLPLFQTWSQRRVVDTAYSMERVHYSKGSVLVEQNSEPGCLFFIVVGEVKLLRLMDDDDVHDLNKTHKKNNGGDGDGTRKKKQKHKNSILKPVVGISGLGDRKKEGHANGGKESNDNQTTKKYTTHKKNNQHHGVLDTWRNKTLRDDKHKKNIPASGIAVDGQTDEDAPQTTTTTSSSASSESPFNGDVPTSLQVVRSIKTTPVKKKIVFTSPKHTRRTKPTMELSDLGKRSILGLMSPAFVKTKTAIQSLSSSTRNDGSIGDHSKKEIAKLKRVRKSMLTPWTAIASQETEVFILREKALVHFCARSKGTNMFNVLEETYYRRLYSYKNRFRAAQKTNSYHGLLPLARKAGPFSPMVERVPEQDNQSSPTKKQPGGSNIYVPMPSLVSPDRQSKYGKSRTKKENKSNKKKHHSVHGTVMGDGQGDEEQDMLDTMRKRNMEMQKLKDRSSATTNKKQHFKFGADQQNRRSVALDLALDNCLELHLNEERKKFLE